MARRKAASAENRKSRPALSPEARENQLISMAYDLVEQRLLDGTATSQETTHFLKLGSSKNMLEMEKLKRENELLVSKKEAYDSAGRVEELYSNALQAMRSYSGYGDSDEENR